MGPNGCEVLLLEQLCVLLWSIKKVHLMVEHYDLRVHAFSADNRWPQAEGVSRERQRSGTEQLEL